MKKRYILTIDQSTSSTKVLLIDNNAKLYASVSLLHKQFYPKPNFVEHDAEEIYNNVLKGIKQLLNNNNIERDEIDSLSITNQRETVLIWNKKTGKPIANAAVWQCQRGINFCNELTLKKMGPWVQSKTGLIIDPYFSASKLRWIIKKQANKKKIKSDELLVGTMDSWLLWKLTGGKSHATDFSNACRTMLFNIYELQWDAELSELFEIPLAMLPEVKFSDEIFGYTDPEIVHGLNLPISGLLGDSHAALFGHHCILPGMGKATFGTGSSIMINIGSKPLEPPPGLVCSIGFSCNKTVNYVFEGNIHCTGDTISWMKNELNIIQNVQESEFYAKSITTTNGVYLVPAFVGLGAPYWNNNVRGLICGITRSTTKAHIIRAGIESIAFQVKDLLDLMAEKSGFAFKELRVDGGPTQNNFLMQFLADILRKPIVRSSFSEISSLGSAFMAGYATGFWENMEEINNLNTMDKIFKPKLSLKKTEQLYNGWGKAILMLTNN